MIWQLQSLGVVLAHLPGEIFMTLPGEIFMTLQGEIFRTIQNPVLPFLAFSEFLVFSPCEEFLVF